MKRLNNFSYNVRVGLILIVYAIFCMAGLVGFIILIVESLKAGI